MLREYHITPDADYPLFCYGKGCGLIDGFGIEVHDDANDAVQRQSIERFLREKRKPLYAIVGNVAFFHAEPYLPTHPTKGRRNTVIEAINPVNLRDINKPNQPFWVTGRLCPAYQDGR